MFKKSKPVSEASADASASTAVSKRGIKITDAIIFIIIIAIVVVLAKTLIGQLNLKHEVSSARVITDRTISDIQKKNAADLYSIGDASFKINHSIAELNNLFKSASPLVQGTPLIVRQTVTNDKPGDLVRIIYKFTGKQTYYVSVTAARPAGQSKWQVIKLGGNTNETTLLTSN